MSIRYEHAPITEALIDLRVDPQPGVSLSKLEAIHGEIRHLYPLKKKRVYVRGQFSAGEEVGATASQKDVGFAFFTPDEKQIFQAGLDGFTFSRLSPYGTWGELRDEARHLWAIYSAAVNPLRITRVAVRYINQIDIPFPADGYLDYKDYFRTAPEVAAELTQTLSGFFMQLHFPQPDFGGMLTLTQNAGAPSSDGVQRVILDLDVFKDGMIINGEEWDLLETLRNRKNEFFEGSVTDKARALFGKGEEY